MNAAVAAALLLAGCRNDDGSTANATPSPSSGGHYAGGSGGAHGSGGSFWSGRSGDDSSDDEARGGFGEDGAHGGG